MKSLLILACSNRKVNKRGALPAIERYDGGSYRVIRKYQREAKFPHNVDIVILSAKFGLIDSSLQIKSYDIRMNGQIAIKLKTRVQNRLKSLLSRNLYSEIYVDLGKDYLTVIEGFEMPKGINLIIAKGRIGERLKSLREWLSKQ